MALCALSACDDAREAPPGPVPTSYSMETPDKPVPMPSPAPKEKCYGIAKAQANHGGAKGPGTARLDRQSDAWLFVAPAPVLAARSPHAAIHGYRPFIHGTVGIA